MHLLQAFEAAGADDGVAYLSVPITSGKRELELLAALHTSLGTLQSVHRDRWLAEVVTPNEQDAARYAATLRAQMAGTLVVDPSRMRVVGWDQNDYNTFWIALIERFAVRIIAAPGWEFSRGARGEIALALVRRLPVQTIDGATLDENRARHDAEKALEEAHRLGLPDEVIREALPAFDAAVAGMQGKSPATLAFDWLAGERAYQVWKFGTELDDEHTLEGLADTGWWWRQLSSYFHRARVLGLDNPTGRQALAKFVATGCGLVESVIRVYGPLPRPGVPSGEIGEGSAGG
jgi:hypothetical protein